MSPEPSPRPSLKTPRTELGHRSDRGRHDRETVYAVLDAAWICHVGFVHRDRPVVMPMIYGRRDDRLFLHGAVRGRLMESLGRGIPICVEATVVDGLVFARSTFHSSVNYRSAVIFGHAVPVEEEDKAEALEVIVEHLMPGRTRDARAPSPGELQGTAVLEIPIDEASAKVRSGPPKDAAKDLDLPIWAGELPLSVVAGRPVAAPDLRQPLEAPSYVRDFSRD